MLQTMELLPGVQLSCIRDPRFKQGCLSLYFLRSMGSEAGQNALLPAVLLRGTEYHPDLRAITQRLDELYGAAISPQVHRLGDHQLTGFYCAFMDDRFAMDGEPVLAPVVEFLREILLRPRLQNGCFPPEVVEIEKKNLIAAIEAARNDKSAYAVQRLMEIMCPEDTFSLPRLGTTEQVAAITAQELSHHYRRILRESPIHLFYAGSQGMAAIAALLKPMLADLERESLPVAESTPLRAGKPTEKTEVMEVMQGKLCMGFTVPITAGHPQFPALQLLNCIFGGGMTSKLFLTVREKMSLCYSIHSSVYSSKGILLVAAGIDFDKEAQTREEILHQLRLCQEGQITQQELAAAKSAMLSSLRAVHDSPSAMENYYVNHQIGGLRLHPEEYMAAVERVTMEDVVEAARQVQLHSTYFLRGQIHGG